MVRTDGTERGKVRKEERMREICKKVSRGLKVEMERREDTSWKGEQEEEEGKLDKKEGMRGKERIV